MDQSLDDVISDRQRRNNGGRNRRQNNWQDHDSRKMNGRSKSANIDIDWIHDKYEDDPQTRRPTGGPRNPRLNRYSPEHELLPPGAKLRVENLHYDLTEEDLEGLFNRIGPVAKLSLCFDRAGRSSGTAFVTYATLSDARAAIREFDGANANGQPIRLTLLPTGPKFSSVDGMRGRGAARNPFDTAIVPGRSLFERIEDPGNRARGNVARGGAGRSRSRSPGAPRRTNTSKPAPEGVDRYVPPRDGRGSGRRRSRSRSVGRRGRAREDGRGRAREDGRGRAREDGREKAVDGRVRKTQEELDREMEDYWSASGTAEANGTQAATNGETTGNLNSAPTAVIDDGDIDMIE